MGGLPRPSITFVWPMVALAPKVEAREPQPVVEVGLMVRQDLLAAHVLEPASAVEELHGIEQPWLARPRSPVVAGQEDLLPTLPHRVALRPVLQEHRLVRVHVPKGHAVVVGEGEGQLRPLLRLPQQQLRVVACRARHVLAPLRALELRAHAIPRLWRAHCGVREAGGVVVAKHPHNGRERLVAHGKVGVVVAAHVRLLRVPVVAHANDLAPDGTAKDALAARHEEPNGHNLRVAPMHAADAVHVAREGGALFHHLVPILVQGPEEHRGDI
mmetsp:Transcript_7215/g.22568  ORF Transcript_7215/g.22568 Transcript_7215/m.22568 type:complete len:271 (+) Transcript_7215:273-1085(+)